MVCFAEEIEGPQALAWVEAQNERTLAAFGTARFAADRDSIAAMLDRPDKIPGIARRRPYFCNFWTDAQQPRGLWRRTTPESFRLEQAAWEVLLDLTRSQRRRARDWIWGAPRRRARNPAMVRCRAAAAMLGFCASSILGPRPLSATALSCRKPRAGRVGSIPTRCCWPVLGAATSRPRATPGRCGCGGGAPTRRGCLYSSTCHARACRPAPRSIARSGQAIWFYDAVGSST